LNCSKQLLIIESFQVTDVYVVAQRLQIELSGVKPEGNIADGVAALAAYLF